MEVYVYGKTPPFLLSYYTTVQGSEGGGGGGSKFLSAPPFYSSSLQEEGILSNVQSMYNGVSMKICLRLARSKKGGPRPRSCTGSSFYSFFALKKGNSGMFCKIEFPPDGEKRNMKAFLLSPSDLGLAKGRKGEKREENKLFNKKGLSFSQSKSAAATSCLRLRTNPPEPFPFPLGPLLRLHHSISLCLALQGQHTLHPFALQLPHDIPFDSRPRQTRLATIEFSRHQRKPSFPCAHSLQLQYRGAFASGKRSNTCNKTRSRKEG